MQTDQVSWFAQDNIIESQENKGNDTPNYEKDDELEPKQEAQEIVDDNAKKVLPIKLVIKWKSHGRLQLLGVDGNNFQISYHKTTILVLFFSKWVTKRKKTKNNEVLQRAILN